MSVIVKGMKMPKSCIFCPISHWNKLDELTGCEIHQKHIPNTEKEFWEKDRPDWCHLVEVPTPHGDLIYREYAIAAACSGRIRTLPTTGDGEDWIRVKEVLESIKAAPTIIPAEDGE